VDARFVQAVRGSGYGDLAWEQLVELRDHGVDPGSIAEIRRAFEA
jgi:hypothetical protein